MFCEVFSLCYVVFLACVMCCSHAYDTSLRSVRALRARCGRFAPAGLFAWLLVVARLPGWSWQPVCPATFLPGSNPVVSSGQIKTSFLAKELPFRARSVRSK